MNRSCPDREDFIVHGSLDEEWACDALLGSSVKDMASRLEENFVVECDHFVWMGPRAFPYFLPALLSVVRHHNDPSESYLAFVYIAEQRFDDLRGRPFAGTRRHMLDLLHQIGDDYAREGASHKAGMELRRAILMYESLDGE